MGQVSWMEKRSPVPECDDDGVGGHTARTVSG